MALKKNHPSMAEFQFTSKIAQIGWIHLKFGHFLPAATLGAVVTCNYCHLGGEGR